MGVTEEDGCKWEYFFDQGDSLQCTLFAIARSICNSSRRDGYLLHFDEILESLTRLSIYELKYNDTKLLNRITSNLHKI